METETDGGRDTQTGEIERYKEETQREREGQRYETETGLTFVD